MSFVRKPWQLSVVAMGTWINYQQRELIDYLLTENRVPKETQGPKRNAERRTFNSETSAAARIAPQPRIEKRGNHWYGGSVPRRTARRVHCRCAQAHDQPHRPDQVIRPGTVSL